MRARRRGRVGRRGARMAAPVAADASARFYRRPRVGGRRPPLRRCRGTVGPARDRVPRFGEEEMGAPGAPGQDGEAGLSGGRASGWTCPGPTLALPVLLPADRSVPPVPWSPLVTHGRGVGSVKKVGTLWRPRVKL